MPDALLRLEMTPKDKVLYLKGRLRCRECGRKGRATAAIASSTAQAQAPATAPQMPPVQAPERLDLEAGSASGGCFAGPRSPRPPPFAPPAPQPVARLCSSASPLLWRGLSSYARASPALAPRLPDADQSGWPPLAERGISQVPARSFRA